MPKFGEEDGRCKLIGLSMGLGDEPSSDSAQPT